MAAPAAPPGSQEAQAAREQTQGYRLDKNHVFAVNMFDDFEKYAKVPDVYAEPDTKAFQAAVSACAHGAAGAWAMGPASQPRHALPCMWMLAHSRGWGKREEGGKEGQHPCVRC
jgi:hypothetical protein